MKYVKWAALILVVLAIVAAVVVQWRRDAIALDIANRVLRDTDFVVASIAVRTLGVDHIELSSIVLETPDGASYELVGVYYPLTTRGEGPRRVTIESLAASGLGTQRKATSYIELARTFLALPETLANTDVRVQRLTIESLPDMSAISWATSGRGQALTAEVAGLAATAAVMPLASDAHEVRVTLSDATGAEALRGVLSFTDAEQRVGIDGDVQVDLAVLEPLLREMDWLPAQAEAIAATAAGPIAVDLDVGGDGNLAVRFEPAFPSDASLTWRGEDDESIVMTLDADARADVAFAYPSLLWTVDAEQVHGTLRLDDRYTIATTFSDVRCLAGVRCTLGAAARVGPLAWGDIEIETVEASKVVGITFGMDATGWSAEVERIDVAVDNLRSTSGLLASVGFVASDVKLADGLSSIEARFRSPPGAGRLQYADFEIAVPGVEGMIKRAGDSLASSLELFDKAHSLSANIDFDYDVAGARGSARIRDGVVDFGRRKLSERVVGWSYAWDVIAGTWAVTAELDWTTSPEALRYRGRSTHRIEGLAGVYNDIGIAGAATTLETDIDSATGLALHPAAVRVELIEVGVPIGNVTGTVVPDFADLSVRIDGLSGTLLGGRFAIDPFTYSLAAERNNLQVRLERIQPQFMVDIAEFEQLKVTGTMSGMLPVTLIQNTVRIDGGQLINDPPGGVISYRGGDMGAGSNEQLAMVTGALSNFVYDSLSADVDYSEGGDLRLGMRLEGINPDRDPTQPIILNLNVDNNIPQMLRSLQAVRSIEDILERRAGN